MRKPPLSSFKIRAMESDREDCGFHPTWERALEGALREAREKLDFSEGFKKRPA